MSRHLLIDRPDRQVVVGFDHMLLSFFGQVFDPSRDPGIAIAGWPTSSGLGMRRPAVNHILAGFDHGQLKRWAWEQFTPDDQDDDIAQDHFEKVFRKIYFEWTEGSDEDSRPVPANLREPQP